MTYHNLLEKRFRKKINKLDFLSEEEIQEANKIGYSLFHHIKEIPFHFLNSRSGIRLLLKNKGIYYPALLKRLHQSFCTDRENFDVIFEMLCSIYGYQGFKDLPEELRGNRDFVVELLQRYKKNYEFDDDVRSYDIGKWVYDYVSYDLSNDKEVILLALSLGVIELPNRFHKDKEIIIEYLKAMSKKDMFSSKEIDCPFDFRKLNISENFASKMIDIDPSNYQYLPWKYRRRKDFAIRSIKAEIRIFDYLPLNLMFDHEIANYVLSIEPSILKHGFSEMTFENIQKIEFSRINLNKSHRRLIFNYVRKNDRRGNNHVFNDALAKKLIFSDSSSSPKKNPLNSLLFNKDYVLREIKESNLSQISRIYRNMSFELKEDKDIRLAIIKKIDVNYFFFNDTNLYESKWNRQINQQLFIEGKYHLVELPLEKGQLREYMISKIYKSYDLPIYFESFRSWFHLTDDEKKRLIADSPILTLRVGRGQDALMSYLSRAQKIELINDSGVASSYYLHLDKKFIKNNRDLVSSKNIRLEKALFLNDPDSFIDIFGKDRLKEDYLFKPYLDQNVTLPLLRSVCSENRSFILNLLIKKNKKVISKIIKNNLHLYKHLPHVLKIDKKITDYVLTLEPELAKELDIDDFFYIDPSKLHPLSRRIVFDEYLKKHSGNSFELAHMRKIFLQIRDDIPGLNNSH